MESCSALILPRYARNSASSARRVHGIHAVVTGDAVPPRENAIVVANHQQMPDITFLMMWAREKDRLGDLKWVVKDVIKYVPGVGWGMAFIDCVFVKRDWTADRASIERHLSSCSSCRDEAASAMAFRSALRARLREAFPGRIEPHAPYHYNREATQLLRGDIDTAEARDVLEKATGRPVLDFANAELFRPLGVANVPPSAWATDPQGYPDGSSGLYLTPQDVARFGLLYLNRGAWAGKQVVPAGWVKASLTACTTPPAWAAGPSIR